METGQEFLAIDHASAVCASIFAVGVICEFSRRSTVRRTFRAAATLAAGGESADFRVTLLAGFDPFAVVRRRDRDAAEDDADRDVLRRAGFFLVAALRPPAVLVAMVPALHVDVMPVSAV